MISPTDQIRTRFQRLVLDHVTEDDDNPSALDVANAVSEMLFAYANDYDYDAPYDISRISYMDSVISVAGRDWARRDDVADRLSAWVSHEVDLMTCPFFEGDEYIILRDGAHDAEVSQGDVVRVVRNITSLTNVATVIGDDSMRWYMGRGYMMLNSFPCPENALMREFDPLLTWVQRDITGLRPPRWINLDQAASAFAGVGMWPSGEWTASEEGKNWLGRVVRFYRNRWVAQSTEGEQVALVGGVLTEMSVEQLQAEIARLEAARAQDIAMISTEMQREARERAWCSEYDRVIERINERLEGPKMIARPREIRVRVSRMAAVPVYYDITVQEVAGEEMDTTVERQFAEASITARSLVRGGYYDVDQIVYNEDTPLTHIVL
jgi:hypothetical protein